MSASIRIIHRSDGPVRLTLAIGETRLKLPIGISLDAYSLWITRTRAIQRLVGVPPFTARGIFTDHGIKLWFDDNRLFCSVTYDQLRDPHATSRSRDASPHPLPAA